MKFYLGTHMPAWLWRFTVAPLLFVSYRRLVSVKGLHPARCDWALDSGGFTELRLHGRWTVDAATYVAEVRRYQDGIGRLQWAAPQDWMCEADCLAKTGKSVAEHQALTIRSVLELRDLELRDLAPEIQWIPVLQGMTAGDYLDHAEQYERGGYHSRTSPSSASDPSADGRTTTRSCASFARSPASGSACTASA